MPNNPLDEAYLQEVLSTIESITPLGRRKFEKRLSNLVDAREVADLVRTLQMAEQPYYFWQGGQKKLARAWLLVTLGQSGALDMGFTSPDEHYLTTQLSKLAGYSESAMRSDIIEALSGRGLLKAFAEAQVHPDRNQWNPAANAGIFTHPSAQSKGNFRYLVTALRFDAITLGIPRGQERKAEYLTKDETYKGYVERTSDGGIKILSSQRYLERPEALQSQVLACSVIDQSHTKTYQNACFGFILQVPRELIITASGADTQSNSWIYKAMGADLVTEELPIDRLLQGEDFLENMLGKYTKQLPTPAEVLESSRSGSRHNEVNVLGSNGAGLKVKPVGLFVKTTRQNKLFKVFVEGCKTLGPSIKKCHVGQSIPIVPIPDDSGEASDVDFDSWLKSL